MLPMDIQDFLSYSFSPDLACVKNASTIQKLPISIKVTNNDFQPFHA